MAHNIISTGLNTGNTIFNSNGGILISGDAVKGGYFVTDTIENIPSWSEVAGTLCYCTADSKFYQYDGSTWIEKEFGTKAEANTSNAGLMSASDKQKLDKIAAGAEVNVQSDWNVTDENSDAFIKNKPTIPTVNNATLTIQKNGTNVATFTANSASNATANIVVPTKTSDLINDSGFKTDEATLTVTDKADIDTTDLIYAVTNLVEDGTKGHTITPTYTGLPTKTYVDKIATGHVKYLGTVSASTGLATTAGQGDFYRVSTQFTFESETAHVGDILIATKDKPGQNTTDWDLIHTEVDSNTWVENKVNAAGYVTAPGASNANKVWKTDGSGNPGWRDDANVDTGATSVEVTGSGNVVTAATYNATTRKLTLTKGATSITTDTIKAEVENQFNNLISSGMEDPSASITSQYYFKYTL